MKGGVVHKMVYPSFFISVSSLSLIIFFVTFYYFTTLEYFIKKEKFKMDILSRKIKIPSSIQSHIEKQAFTRWEDVASNSISIFYKKDG